jgi:hypothetical protein
MKQELFCPLWVALLALATSLCCSEANAERSVPGSGISFEGWSFIPTYNNNEIETILALRTDGGAQGENIVSIWYTRAPNGHWETWGWPDQDKSKAIGYVKSVLALSDNTDQFWPIAPTPVNPADHPAKQMVRGVFVDDPLADVVAESADPRELVEFLVSIGWSAAANSVIDDFQCALVDGTDGLVEALEVALTDTAGALTVLQSKLPPNCQGAPGTGTCTPNHAYGVITTGPCVQTVGWTVTTTMAPTTGSCCPKNTWTGTFRKQQNRTYTYTCADCTTGTINQFRFQWCTGTVTQIDTGQPQFCTAGSVPCPAVPAGYTPPSGPAGITGCTGVTMSNCTAWTDDVWGPPGPCPP